MRKPWLGLALALLLIGGLAVAGWLYWQPISVGAQFAGYQVGAAPTFSLAKREIARFDAGRDRAAKDRELVSGWGTGNRQFDFYLAKYLSEPECSDELRQAFSLELGWRPELLPRWAHYWAWRTRQEPADEIASLAEYLTALAPLSPPRSLTWREVLNLQAAFALTGEPDLARRLAPDNWPGRFREWMASKPDWTQVARPKTPLPDWQGPAPE
jgi:hypothetical protein